MGSERKIKSEHKEGMSMEYQLDDDVQAVEFGDPAIMRWTPGPENEPDDCTYFYRPICGSRSGISGIGDIPVKGVQ